MFNWNPLKKKAESTPNNPVVDAALYISGEPNLVVLGCARAPDQLPSNDELVALLSESNNDTHTLRRLFLQCDLWVPVYSAGMENAEQREVLAMVFENESALFAFTDADSVRAFFKGNLPVEGDELNVALVDGRMLCDMATKFDVARLVINPRFDDEWEIAPILFRVLARPLLPSKRDAVPDEEPSPLKPISGAPPEKVAHALAQAAKNGGAADAFWFDAWYEIAGEMRYAVGVDCDDSDWNVLESALSNAWDESSNLQTPLYVLRLQSDDDGKSDFVRSRGVALFAP